MGLRLAESRQLRFQSQNCTEGTRRDNKQQQSAWLPPEPRSSPPLFKDPRAMHYGSGIEPPRQDKLNKRKTEQSPNSDVCKSGRTGERRREERQRIVYKRSWEQWERCSESKGGEVRERRREGERCEPLPSEVWERLQYGSSSDHTVNGTMQVTALQGIWPS